MFSLTITFHGAMYFYYLRTVFGHEKSTYQCDLQPIQFELADFLIPFPWHIFNIAEKKAFFDQHWIKCTEKNAGT